MGDPNKWERTVYSSSTSSGSSGGYSKPAPSPSSASSSSRSSSTSSSRSTSTPKPAVTSKPTAPAKPAAAAKRSFSASAMAHKVLERTSIDKTTLVFKRRIVVPSKSAILVKFDGTGSLDEGRKVVYDKLPMLDGQIEKQGYLNDHSVLFGGFGDAGNLEKYPVQVADPARNQAMETELARIFPEHAGGGNGMESSELMAYYCLNCIDFPNIPKGEKPFLFMITDEACYRRVKAAEVKRFFGIDEPRDIPAEKVFKALMAKYHFFVLQVPFTLNYTTTEQVAQLWEDVLGAPPEMLADPNGVVDAILGFIALTNKTRTIASYAADMKQRGQSVPRIEAIRAMLESCPRIADSVLAAAAKNAASRKTT